MALTPAERVLRSRMASHASWANTTDPVARTAPARDASRASLINRFERQVDPDGTLPEEERARRAEHARKQYFTQLALKSVGSRRRAAEARRDAAKLDGDADAAETELNAAKAELGSVGPNDAAGHRMTSTEQRAAAGTANVVA